MTIPRRTGHPYVPNDDTISTNIFVKVINGLAHHSIIIIIIIVRGS